MEKVNGALPPETGAADVSSPFQRLCKDLIIYGNTKYLQFEWTAINKIGKEKPILHVILHILTDIYVSPWCSGEK